MVISKCDSMSPIFNYSCIQHIAGYSISDLVQVHDILEMFLFFLTFFFSEL